MKRNYTAPSGASRCTGTRRPLRDGTTAQCMRKALPGSSHCGQHSPAAMMIKHPAGLTTMSADERRAYGRKLDDTGRRKIAEQLEQVRMIKQHATPKSEAWYVADLHITAYCDALFAGRTIDPLATLDAAAGDDEA
jgi:hypothetical protein